MGGFDTVAFGVEALLMTTHLKRCDGWRTTSERMGVEVVRLKVGRRRLEGRI